MSGRGWKDPRKGRQRPERHTLSLPARVVAEAKRRRMTQFALINRIIDDALGVEQEDTWQE